MKLDIPHFKATLEKEREQLVEELRDLGKVNPENNDWEAVPVIEELDQKADDNERADQFEDFEERSATLNVLEQRLENIDAALKRIEEGAYGTCEVCGGEIETSRLEANPAAKTCKAHING